MDKKNKQTTNIISFIWKQQNLQKSTDCISGPESRNVTSWLHALTTDSGKWLDVYRRRPQGLELDLLEYGNSTQHQRGRDKKLTYGDGGGTCTHAYAPRCRLSRSVRWMSAAYTHKATAAGIISTAGYWRRRAKHQWLKAAL